jgi:hypothetical protein
VPSAAQEPGGALVERWLGPLSRALYGVMFDLHPQGRAAEQARRVMKGPAEQIAALCDEIRRELEHPTQPVREIHDSLASEQELREYLRLLVDEIERAPRS